MANQLPADIELFIAQHIESLAQLEALLLAAREPGRDWGCEDMSRQLYIGPDVCATIMDDLQRRGFLERTPANPDRFRYHAKDAGIDRLMERLAALYEERRVAVITQIYSKPINKVQTFADAFRLRKET
jgi:hypothetical protein